MDEIAHALPGPKFEIITKALQPTPKGEDGRRRFHMTASSTIVDRSGDEMEVRALEGMARQFREGKTIFMDHKFREVDKAFGVSDSAELVQRGIDPETGGAIWDLDIGGVVNVPNPKALQLADSIDGGYVKLGASVTAIVRKHTRKPNTGGMKIAEVDLIEGSIVGVADNPRSWARGAAIAIKGFGHTIEDDEDNEEEPVDVQSDNEPVETGAETPDDAGSEPAGAVTDETPIAKELNAADEAATTGNDAAPEAADAEPDQESAEEAAIATGDEATPAGESPDEAAAEAEPDPETEKAYDPADVKELVSHTARLVARIDAQDALIVAKDAEIEALNAKIAAFEAEASQIKDEVDTATQVIEKVLQQPLRARTADYIEKGLTPASLFSQVSPEIADFLSKRSKLNG